MYLELILIDGSIFARHTSWDVLFDFCFFIFDASPPPPSPRVAFVLTLIFFVGAVEPGTGSDRPLPAGAMLTPVRFFRKQMLRVRRQESIAQYIASCNVCYATGSAWTIGVVASSLLESCVSACVALIPIHVCCCVFSSPVRSGSCCASLLWSRLLLLLFMLVFVALGSVCLIEAKKKRERRSRRPKAAR